MAELVHEAHGVRYAIHPDVYDPSHDTFLLARVVAGLPPGRILEVGTGTGFVSIVAASKGHSVTATDVNPNALSLARANAARNGVDVGLVRADVCRGIRAEKFDCVVFNPPYLPTMPGDRVPGPLNAAFDGGPRGLRVVEAFLASLPRRFPAVIMVASSLQGPPTVDRLLARRGLVGRTVAGLSLPHERLSVLEVSPAPTRKG